MPMPRSGPPAAPRLDLIARAVDELGPPGPGAVHPRKVRRALMIWRLPDEARSSGQPRRYLCMTNKHLSRPMKAGITALSAIAALVAATTVPASAASAQSVGISAPKANYNGYWELHLSPGESYSSSVTVSNPGGTAETYNVAGVWAATGATSGIGYSRIGEGTPAGALSAWADVSQWISGSTSAELSPGQTATEPWSITVPAGTPAGTYVGGIAASPETNSVSSSPSGNQESQSASVGIVSAVEAVEAVVVVVGSPSSVTASVPTVALVNNWAYDGGVADVTIDYTGAVIAAPKLQLQVTTCAGATVYSGILQLGNFVPGTAITYPWQLKVGTLSGCYSVTAAASYDGQTLASDAQSGTIAAGSSDTWAPEAS